MLSAKDQPCTHCSFIRSVALLVLCSLGLRGLAGGLDTFLHLGTRGLELDGARLSEGYKALLAGSIARCLC